MYIGALDIGGTKTIVGIIDQNGSILCKYQFATNTYSWRQHFLSCCTVLRQCLDSISISFDDLYGIGINMPGMVNNKEGILLKAVYKGWENIDVKSFFRRETGIDHIVVENDVNACAIGELLFGYKDTYKNFIWMTVSTGIGGALVSEGRLIRGGWNCAGEFGHLKVEYEHSALCPCGQSGCLEAHASGTAITRYTKEAIREDPLFEEDFSSHKQPMDAIGCSVLARQGNRKAIEIYEKAAVWLGRGISYCVNVLNPEAVVIGGGVASSLDLMTDVIKRTTEKNVHTTLSGFDIKVTRLGYEAALLGAAALVMWN